MQMVQKVTRTPCVLWTGHSLRTGRGWGVCQVLDPLALTDLWMRYLSQFSLSNIMCRLWNTLLLSSEAKWLSRWLSIAEAVSRGVSLRYEWLRACWRQSLS